MELKNIRIAKSAVSDNIYAGFVDGDGSSWIEKTDVTSDFISAVLARWNGFKETIEDESGNKFEITVKQINQQQI